MVHVKLLVRLLWAHIRVLWALTLAAYAAGVVSLPEHQELEVVFVMHRFAVCFRNESITSGGLRSHRKSRRPTDGEIDVIAEETVLSIAADSPLDNSVE